MQKLFYFILITLPGLFFSQNNSDYYKISNTEIGLSAISINTLSAVTYSFNYPVYKIVADTVAGQLMVSIRQKNATGKSYTNKGCHLTLKKNDSVQGIIEDNKFELKLSGDFLLLSDEDHSARYNRQFGYEQFEYPSTIILPFKNNAGLSYHPSVKMEKETALSSLNLNDGTVLWSAPVSSKQNWNGTLWLNDSVVIIAAAGLHALNINSGFLWGYPLLTTQKIVKPLSFSSFNRNSFDKIFHPTQTSREEAIVTQICSNVLVADSNIYFMSKNKFLCVNNQGRLVWQKDVSGLPLSSGILFDNGENILLVNLGVALYDNKLVQYGKPFVSFFDKKTGEKISTKDLDAVANLVDVLPEKHSKLLANKDRIVHVAQDMSMRTLFELGEARFGKFLEFINGDEYYIEKEGFHVPLNFINDNVIYFKTDHDKVFGLNNDEIEYEYHFTELFRFNKKTGNKKLLCQKNKTILISDNYELLCTFNTGEPLINLWDKIYFYEGRLLHIVNIGEFR